MANLIFPTCTSNHGEGTLLEVHLAGSSQFYYTCISTGYISVDEMYMRYVATHVTWISVLFFTFRDE